MGITREAYLDLMDKEAKPKIRQRREAEIQLQIIKYLRLHGYACGKTKTYAMPTKNGVFRKDIYCWRGFPDLVAFVPELIFIEVKAKSRQSDEQKWFQELCGKAGVKYILAYSVEDVRDYILKNAKIFKKR